MTIPLIGDGVFFGMLSAKQKEAVLQSVAEEAASRFNQYVDSLVQAFDFRNVDAQGRYAMYQARQMQEWQLLQQAIPDEYQKQLQDYYILERRIKGAVSQAPRPSVTPVPEVAG